MLFLPKIQEAVGLIDAFKRRTSTGAAFFTLSRQTVADSLRARVITPSKIDQGEASLCGPASLLFNIAIDDPAEYAQFAIDLFEKGRAKLNDLEIKPCDDLKNYSLPPACRMDQADWLTLASIRDSENWAGPFCYDAITNKAMAITWPNEIEEWFKKSGYTQVINKASKWLTKDRANAEEASIKYNNQEFHVVLLINDGILQDRAYDDSHSVFTAPTHYVVLRSQIQFRPSVKFSVYSWGQPAKTIPPLGRTLSEEDFLGNYFGYIAAKF